MWYYSYFPTEPNAELPMYLYSIGMHDTQPLLVRPEGHRHDQFFYNTTGSGTILIYGQKYNIPEKSSFFIPAHVPHEYYPNTDIWDIRWFVEKVLGRFTNILILNLAFIRFLMPEIWTVSLTGCAANLCIMTLTEIFLHLRTLMNLYWNLPYNPAFYIEKSHTRNKI